MITRTILPVTLAIIIAVVVSFAVQGFISFVDLVSSFLRGDQSIFIELPKTILLVSGPILAGLIVSTIYKIANLDRWHGPAESILAAHIPEKRPNTEAGLLSTLASAISLSGGASVGQYGPLVHFGGVIGDYVSKLTKDQTPPHILLACGAAAAISSGFGAPIAGLIFAHEVIVRHFSLKAVAPILVSSIVAHTVSTEFYGGKPLFQSEIGGIAELYEILPLIIIGIFSGLVASIYMRGLTGYLPIPKKIPSYILPIIAGIICGIIGLFVPEVLGLGSETIQILLVNEKTIDSLIILLIAKLFLTVVCIRLNLFGGIFSPALFIGATLGCIFAISFELILPTTNTSLFAIAGMAAVTGCVIGGPISTMMIIFELTSDYQVALGAGISICFANLVSSKIYGHSAFDQILLNRNIDIQIGRDSLQLQSIKIGSIIRKDFIRLSAEHSVIDMIKILSRAKSSEGYIIDPKGVLIGKIFLPDLLLIKSKTMPPNSNLYKKYLRLNENINILEAIEKIKNFVGESVPVTDNKKNILGVVTESDLFNQLLTAESIRKSEELSD